MASELSTLKAEAARLEELYYQNNQPCCYEQRNEYLKQLGIVHAQIEALTPLIRPNQNNQLGEPINQNISPLLLLGGLVAAVLILK